MAKKDALSRGDAVRIVSLRQDAVGQRLPEDAVGKTGTVQWITPGFAGEKAIFEVRLDDGRIVQLYATEIEPL